MIDVQKSNPDSKLKFQKVLATGSSKMNRPEVKLLNLTAEYDVSLIQLDNELNKGCVLELKLVSDNRKFNITTSRGNLRIFKTLETAFAFVFEECTNRKSLTFEFNQQTFTISEIGAKNEKN